MRLPIPNRISPKYAILYIAVLFVAQIAEGTDLLFAVLTAAYHILWVAAFNMAGGLEYPSGAFLLANGLDSVVIGFGAKAILGEAGQRNMLAPETTMLCYCLGMTMMLLVAFLTRALRPSLPLIKRYRSLPEMKQASIICLVVGFGITAVIVAAGGAFGGGALLGALSQISQGFPVMAIVLATTYEVKRTDGRRSVNWVTTTVIVFYVFFGLINFGKSILLLGFVAWIVAAVLNGYNFKKGLVAGLAFGAFFFSYYLTPYSQYMRTQRTGSIMANLPVAIDSLEHLQRTREEYLAALALVDIQDQAHLYDERAGFLDRLVIVAADDKLINFTQEGHVFGLSPTIASYANIVPRIIWRNKPSEGTGNIYAHEFGDTLAEGDTTTGISFSPTADAFHQAKWLGVLTVLPLNLFLCFIVFDSVAGSAKYSPVALQPIIALFLIGGEGSLGGPVYAATYGLIGLLAIIWSTKVAGPFVLRMFQRNQQAGHPVDVVKVVPVSRSGTEIST